MENTTSRTKNVTLSFKTTTEEKTALQQIAIEKQISRSELISSLVYAYKHSYDFIGKSSPREEELKLELEKVWKENRRLKLSVENAEHRIDMEQKANRKYRIEQLEMNKTIFDLQVKLKGTHNEIFKLNERIKLIQVSTPKNGNSEIMFNSMGSLILSGISLILMPFILSD